MRLRVADLDFGGREGKEVKEKPHIGKMMHPSIKWEKRVESESQGEV